MQSEIEGRIQEDTPRLKPQSIYRGAQVGVFSENPQHVNNLMPGVVAASDKKAAEYLLETPESSYIFMAPIGNSAFNSKNMAAWNVGFYKAGLVSANYAWTGSANPMAPSSSLIPTTFIPQLGCNINFEAHFYPPQEEGFHESIVFDTIPTTLNDNAYLSFVEDFAFLKVEEANTEFTKENFELEVYRVKSEAVGTTSEVLERLYFSGEVDEVSFDEKTVEYYFDIEVDFDIDEEEFCKLNRQKEQVKNIYVDKIFNCEDLKALELAETNIYGTQENQDVEVCD